jgi:hypothetical protein
MADQYTKNSLPTDCETLRDLIPAYAAGFTDPDETALVESLLTRCPEEAAELADYQKTTEALLYSAPLMKPPAHSLDNILREATADSKPEAPLKQAERPRIIWVERRWMIGVAVSAAVIALLLINVLSLMQIGDLRDDHDQLESRVNTQSQLLNRFAADDITRFPIEDARENLKVAQGIVLCNPNDTAGVLHAENFPADPDTRYQVWLWKGEETISVGWFTVDADGEGSMVFDAPEQMGNYQYVRISQHVDGGDGDLIAWGSLYMDGWDF